jgi:hypothetical protein
MNRGKLRGSRACRGVHRYIGYRQKNFHLGPAVAGGLSTAVASRHETRAAHEIAETIRKRRDITSLERRIGARNLSAVPHSEISANSDLPQTNVANAIVTPSVQRAMTSPYKVALAGMLTLLAAARSLPRANSSPRPLRIVGGQASLRSRRPNARHPFKKRQQLVRRHGRAKIERAVRRSLDVFRPG